MLVVLGAFLTTIFLSEFILGSSKEDNNQTDYLEEARLLANVECLQNSQCSKDCECIANKCIEIKEISKCQSVDLTTPTRKLREGYSLNAYKRVITQAQLPHLLAVGELVEIKDSQLIEYFYIQNILISDYKIEKEKSNYVIKTNPNKPLYTLRVTFSNNVDFSDEKIQGQVLRILGNEYIIGKESTNSAIYLVSDDKEIELKKSENVKINSGLINGAITNIMNDSNGKVARFEVAFYISDKKDIVIKGDAINGVFDSIRLSFDPANINDLIDARIGGKC